VVRLQSADPDGTGPLLPLNRRYHYDARGNSLSETEFSGGLSRTNTFSFDFRDLLTSQTSVDGRTTTFEYDLLQRSRKETSPTGATIEREYRVDGLLSRIDRSNLRSKHT
jgi:YD repeat-containing protein